MDKRYLSEKEIEVLDKELDRFRVDKTLGCGDRVNYVDLDRWLAHKGAMTRYKDGTYAVKKKYIEVLDKGYGIMLLAYEVYKGHFNQWKRWKGKQEEQQKDIDVEDVKQDIVDKASIGTGDNHW